MQSVEDIMGGTVEQFTDRLQEARPSWVTGSLSHEEARFLFHAVLEARTETIVEIGTAAGFSDTVACHALDVAYRAGLIGPDFRVISYDVSSVVYFDTSRTVGDAAREQLPPHLLAHVEFRNPARAADAADDFGPDSLRLLFIDGGHAHPWPALDLLAMLPSLAPGATVVLDDINLPVHFPQFKGSWGAKYLFDDLTTEKRLSSGYSSKSRIPSMGSIVIPPDKDSLRAEILDIIARHEWEQAVDPAYLRRIGVDHSS